MPTKSPSETDVLFISPLRAGTSGIVSWTRQVVEQGLPDGFRIRVVDSGIRNAARARRESRWAGEGRRTALVLASLLRHLAFARPDIVHLNCSLGSKYGILRDLVCVLLARLRGVPVVTHYRGDVPEFARRPGSRIDWWLLKVLVRTSKLNIAVNRESRAHLDGLQRAVQPTPVYLPNFIRDSVFEPRAVPGPKRSGRTSILYAGLITATKGSPAILALARQLPEADFVLVGPVAADMDGDLDRLPPNVVLGGEVDPDEVVQHMRASDLFLFPSRTEGFPNAVLEAMASGLPVVATRVGAVPEMIEEGKGGLLVGRADLHELADVLGFLLAKPEVRRRMGRFNRRKCLESYAYSVVAPRLASLYRRILDVA